VTDSGDGGEGGGDERFCTRCAFCGSQYQNLSLTHFPQKTPFWGRFELTYFRPKTALTLNMHYMLTCKRPLIAIVAPQKLYIEEANWGRRFQICNCFRSSADRSRD